MRHSTVRRAAAPVVLAMAAGAPALGIAAAVPAAADRPTALAARPAPDGTIQTPEQFFGYPLGTEGRLPAFAGIKTYLSQVAAASPKVEYEVVGKTTAGEDYPVVRVSSPANLAKLSHVLGTNELLSDPARMTAEAKKAGMTRDAYAAKLIDSSVPVYYVEAGIHSTEAGNTPAVVNVIHRLATEDSPLVRKILDNVVVLFVPSQNPDGHNLVVDYFDKTAGTSYDRIYPDLYHPYIGHDNNRDWFMATQVESQLRIRLEQKYRPVVQHYMHWAWTTSPRIWMPPYDEPMSPVIDPITVSTSNAIGQMAQRDLIAEGKKGTQTDDAYGIFWNGDVSGYSVFQGTAHWLTEIAAAAQLTYTYVSDTVLEPSKRTMRSPLPYDAKTWTFMQTVQYAESAIISGLRTVASDPEKYLRNLYLVNRNSETYDGPYAYVIPASQRDPYAVYDLLKVFHFGKARIERARRAFVADGQRYGAGSYILRVNQPLGRWIDQLLRVDTYPDEARKCAKCPLILPYSETTDNLAMLFGVTARSIAKPFDAVTQRVSDVKPAATTMPATPAAGGVYALSPTSYGLSNVIADLQKAGVPTYRATTRLQVLGRTLAPGALMVPAKDANARNVLTAASAKTGLPVYAAPSANVPAIKLKAANRIGIVGTRSNAAAGWLRWWFDQRGVPFGKVTADDFGDLAAKYDTIIVPPGATMDALTKGLDMSKYPADWAWARGVPDAGAKLKAFAEAGGNIVALGSGSQTAVTALGLPASNVTPTDRDAFTIPGALLNQNFDNRVPAAWGMPAQWPVWFNNDPAWMISGAARIASRYPTDRDILASGYARGEKALAGAANIATFDVGKGSATIAGGHITFRTWPRATFTVLTNAVYNGGSTPLTADQLAAELR